LISNLKENNNQKKKKKKKKKMRYCVFLSNPSVID
jgi:hypothetical protein